MKRYIVIILFISLCFKGAIAQNDSFQVSIDNELHNCLIDTFGVIGQTHCLMIAINDWDSVMNLNYNILIELLYEEDKKNLSDNQIKWEEYRRSEIELVEKIENQYYLQNPRMTIYPQIALEKEMNITKLRAIELYDYYKLMNKK